MADTKYSDVFAELADDEALKRFENNLPLQRRFLSLSDEDRQKAKLSIYKVLSEDPDFMKRVSEEEEKRKSYLSKVIDDLGNIPQAWRAGNFYSYGGWSDLASTLIDDVNPLQSGEGAKSSAARREELYQNYRKWREENPAPENKTLLGDVATGAAGLVPLFVDMNVEAAAPTLAAAGIGAGVGSVAGGAGAVPAGVAAGLLGYKASMITQSGKVALADIYTSLRDEGFDDATSAAWAYRLAVPYGALEYAGRALAPVSRLALGSGGLRGVIDKIADKGVKNKILNYAAKAGMDIAATGTAESAVEAAQAAMVEGAKQGAGGEEFDAGKMVQAAAEEFKDAAPAMYGMALLGIVPQAGARRVIERVKTGGDKRNAPAAPENAAQPFGGDAAAEAGRQAEGAGGAGVWNSPEAGGQGGLQFGEAEAGGGTRQGGLQFGEAGGSPRADYFIYGADGKLVGTSREPAILPTSGGIYYDSYASAFADAQRRGAPPAFSDGRKVYAILPVESDGRVFYYAAEYDPQAGRRNVELLENPPQGAGGTAGPEWLGAQMETFIEKRRENPDAGPRPYDEVVVTDSIDKLNREINGRYDSMTPEQEARHRELVPLNSPEQIQRYDAIRSDIGKWFASVFGDIYPPAPDSEAILPKFLEAIYAERDLKNAMRVKGLGIVDLLWGSVGKWNENKKRFTDGWGIAHLIERRNAEGMDGMAFAARIPYILELGRVTKEYGVQGNERVNVSLGDNTVVLKKESGKNHWVITAFKKEEGAEGPVSGRNGYNIRNPDFSSEYGASLSNLSSENISESQGENLNFYAAPRVSEGRPANADGGGRKTTPSAE